MFDGDRLLPWPGMDADVVNLMSLIARLSLGGMLIMHGRGKLRSLEGTAKWFDSMGMKPGAVHARLATASEIGAGALMALGLLTTFAAAGFIGLMVVAAVTVHIKNGFLILKEGWEYVFIIGVFALMVATFGPGEWSIDDAMGIADDLDSWTGFLIAGVGGVGAGLGQLGLFYRPPASSD